jgi:uncharacterized BrkB/YihY/UPF0761 family membrane protein
MNWIEAIERIVAIIRGPEKTPEQIEAQNKARIILTFCLILIMIVGAFIMNTTSVEQPMKDIAPADKFNYDTLKTIVVQIFSVMALLLGAKAMTPTPPSLPPKEDDVKPD